MDTELLPGVTCSGCGATGQVVRFSRQDDVQVRELSFRVTKVLRRCESCGGEFENSHDPDWRLDAYAQYRAVKGMVTPLGMREWRERYGLKQTDVTALLGWGEVTLSRYETGSLQSDAHERALVGLMAPERLADALAAKPEAVPRERRVAAMRRIREELGLLSAEELQVIRVKYGLDDRAMGAMVSVTTDIWSAWESGDGAQGRSADAFIRLIARRPDIVRELLERAGLLAGSGRVVLDRVEAEVSRRVSEQTGVRLDQVREVGQVYSRALPEVAASLEEAA